MNPRGGPDDDLMVRTRSALLDALEALDEHRESVVVVGAQAVYLRTGLAPVALAESTKDSDLALDPRTLADDPLVETAMRAGGFIPDLVKNQPGAWQNAMGIPVDLMVPESLSGAPGTKARGGRIPPHDRRATRRARGIEAALVDASTMKIEALSDADNRAYDVKVAGCAALVVAKLHKIGERIGEPSRLNDKDAHDIYRILVAVETEVLCTGFVNLLASEFSRDVTDEAVTHLNELFAAGQSAQGSLMAGRAEIGIGEPETVALAASLLADDLIVAIDAAAAR